MSQKHEDDPATAVLERKPDKKAQETTPAWDPELVERLHALLLEIFTDRGAGSLIKH